jgi:hypothetical protein
VALHRSMISTYRRGIWLGRATAGAASVLAGAMLFAGPASASPAPGTNLLINGNFHTSFSENSQPVDWNLLYLGAETAPYDATINAYDENGQYPPPSGNPDSLDTADEAFYEAGSATGVEGIGGQQTSSTFGSITQADDPQVSYSTAYTDAPEAKNSSWAGSALEVAFTSGGQNYTLIYFNPWTAYNSTFTGSPTNSATVQYIIGPTLGAADTWSTQTPRDLNTDIDNSFGLTTYTVTSVTFADLEDTVNSGSPYPNMDGYLADLDLAEHGPSSGQVPEAPLVVLLPGAAALAVAGTLLLGRRRRTALR